MRFLVLLLTAIFVLAPHSALADRESEADGLLEVSSALSATAKVGAPVSRLMRTCFMTSFPGGPQAAT